MAQAGYTPIKLYASSTAAAVPLAANLDNTNGAELAINITDGKLYYKNNAGVVTLLASNAATTNVSTISFGTTGLTPASGTVNKIDNITATNVTASAATCYVAIGNSATFSSSTIYFIAYGISVPAGASVVVTDKSTPFYLTDTQSIGVFTGTGSAIQFVASFEAIT
jgi:hypothetical protein